MTNTIQQQAEELVNRFILQIPRNSNSHQRLYAAKQCALIAVGRKWNFKRHYFLSIWVSSKIIRMAFRYFRTY